MKIVVDYPSTGEEAAIVGRSLNPEVDVRELLSLDQLAQFSRLVEDVLVDRDVIAYAVAIADATRHPERYGLRELGQMIEYGASPRGPIGLVQAARALALLRGRGYVAATDISDLAADVLRHRIVLTYDALSDGISTDALLGKVLAAVPPPQAPPASVGGGRRRGGA